jgi:hypothetical protein
MKTKQRTMATLIFLNISLILSGCGSGGLSVTTSSPYNTNTPFPTAPPLPTSTFTPTMTPSPTFTPTPTIEPPTQLQNIFEGASMTYYEGFDIVAVEQWNTHACQTVNNGQLEYACTGEMLSRINPLHEGEGLLIDFKHNMQTGAFWWGINLVNGNFGQDDFRNFGIAESERGPYINIAKGTTNPIGFPSFSIKLSVKMEGSPY